MVRKEILKIKPYIPGKPIEEVQRELGLREVIKLASNESPFGPSKGVITAITKRAKDLNRYPDGNCFYLRKHIAKRLSIRENQLIFGNGSDEIIGLSTRAFVNPGEEIVIAYPTFLIYKIASLIAGAKLKSIPLKDFRYDLVGMKKAVTKKTKIVFIANPDNPTGTYVTEKEVRLFLKDLPNNLIVYFDEAYFELVEEKDYPNTIEMLKENKNIIVTRSFSKAYSLAGLRIGYGISCRKIISYLERVREPFNVNSLAQIAALASLEDKSHLLRLKKTIREGKRFIYENLRQLGLDFIPSATNFILINTKQNGALIYRKLLKQGVIVRDMGAWGLNNFIRATIGTQKENRKFINALKISL